MGPQWGHGRLPVRRKALLGSRRCQVGAGSENTVRRVLSELAGERWNVRLGGWRPGVGRGGGLEHQHGSAIVVPRIAMT